MGQVTEGERRAQAEHTQVGAGICHGLGGDRQQLEQAGGSQGPCHSHQKGDDQGSGEKGPRGFLQAGGVLGAGLLGDADHAPCGQARAQGCDKKAYRGGAADSGQSGLSDDSAHHQKVHKLIKGLQHIGQQQGEGVEKQRSADGPRREVVALFHGNPVLSNTKTRRASRSPRFNQKRLTQGKTAQSIVRRRGKRRQQKNIPSQADSLDGTSFHCGIVNWVRLRTMCFIPLSGAQVQAELVSPHGAHNLSVRQHVYHTVLPMACQEAALSCGDKKTSLAWGKGGSEKQSVGGFRLPPQSGGPFPRCPPGCPPRQRGRGSGNLGPRRT